MAWITTSWDINGNPESGYDDAETPAPTEITPTDKQVLYGDTGYGPTGNINDENQTPNETKRLEGMNQGNPVNGLGNISPNNPVGNDTSGLTWEKIAQQLGIVDKNGNYDLKKILALTGAGIGAIGAATTPTQTIQSIGQLKAGIPSASTAPAWTDAELAYGRRPMQTGTALQRVYAANMQSPVVPGQRYAEGGDVEGPLTQAFAGAVQGDDGGQSDLIDAKLSPGEYVIDAESVSALGDGNTAAGIAKLDELRQQLRAQKRGAPVDDIPPQAQGPLSYMQGA